MRINADTSSVYAYHYVIGTGGALFTGASFNRDLGHLTDRNGAGLTSSPSVAIIDYLDYTNTNKFKTVRILQGYDGNTTGGNINFESNLWRSTSAITSIQIYAPSGGNLVQNSKFALYGIKG